MMRDISITKLSDEYGQYIIYIRCECGHVRRCHPCTLAASAGWDAPLEAVLRRLRCSKCNKKKCTARTVALTAPRGYKSH